MIGFPDQKLKSRTHIYLHILKVHKKFQLNTNTMTRGIPSSNKHIGDHPTHQAPPENKRNNKGKEKKESRGEKLSRKDEIGWLNSTKMCGVTIDNTTLHRLIIPRTCIVIYLWHSHQFTAAGAYPWMHQFRHLSIDGCFLCQTFKVQTTSARPVHGSSRKICLLEQLEDFLPINGTLHILGKRTRANFKRVPLN